MSFAIRGCAEPFAAIDEGMLAERGDNQCVQLHGSLDLRECVCKHRKSSYRGSDDDRIEAASQQVVQFTADAQTSVASQISMPFAFSLTIFCHIIFRWFS